MPSKRKQQRVEIKSSAIPPITSDIRLSPTGPKRQASEDTTEDSLQPTPPKKTKGPILKLKLTCSTQRTRKPSTQHTKQPASDSHVPRSTLLPRGDRKTAKVGQQDTSLLRMLCDDSLSGEPKELHFRNMPHSAIDWNNADHINKINNWRNQIYGRAGMKSKAVILWLEDEELWFELYFQLSIAEAGKRGILLPKSIAILEAFNTTFVGRVLTDNHGKETEPRIERHSNAFASKLNRMCHDLRNRLNHCVFGKSGDTFVPTITLTMLQMYKQMKNAMQEKGIYEESAYADDLEDWTYLFSHLPNADDVEMQDEPVPTVEEDAAATLLSLFTMPVVYEPGTKVEDYRFELLALQEAEELDCNGRCMVKGPYIIPAQVRYDVAAWLSTPELSFSSSFSSSHEFYDRPVTPVHAMDILAMIASPD